MATPIPTNDAAFTVAEIAQATAGHVVRVVADGGAGVTSDSRAVVPGGIFVALRGEHHDGHAFVDAAAGRGASVLVVARGAKVPDTVSTVEVEDTLVAWGDLARAHLARWNGRLVAITGSAGKTTTKELTAALLSAIGPTHFTAGNLNNRIGVPAVVFALPPDARFCVLEMGMSLRGEMDAMVAFARPDVSVIVNVGLAHAEGVGGGREGVMHEKGAVYRALGPEGIAVVNADDPYVVRAASATRARRIETFGDAGSYRILARAASAAGSTLRLACAGRELDVVLPLPGEAAATDLCAALAAQEAASGVKLTAEAIDRALAGLAVPGRGSIRRLANDVLVIDDTYNANPASMRASLATLAELAGARRRVVVLGEMKELGAIAEEEHTALGDAIADAGVALAIGCGGLIAQSLARAAVRGVEVVSTASTTDAAEVARERVQPGDVVLVKGSRDVGAERVVAALER